MKLAAARAIINSAPRTHLGEAARAVLTLLDNADLDRTEAAENHLSVQAEELAAANETIRALNFRVSELEARRKYWEDRYEVERDRLADAGIERDRLARELEEARQPDPDLMRLRALEHTAEQLVRARPPMRAEGRAAYDLIVSHLTPHLAEPKVGA